MSFLDKILNLPKQDAAPKAAAPAPAAHPASARLSSGLSPATRMEGGDSSQPGSSSIISEARPTEQGSGEFAETLVNFATTTAAAETRPAVEHDPLPARAGHGLRQGVLTALVALGLLGTAATLGLSLWGGQRSTSELRSVSEALVQSQRLAKSVNAALAGQIGAFGELRDSMSALSSQINSLRGSDALAAHAEVVLPLVEATGRNALTVLTQEKALAEAGKALRAIRAQSAPLLEAAEAASALALQQGAGPTELSAYGQLVMLTQRIGKSANEIMSADGLGPELLPLGKDVNAFELINKALLSGSPELRLAGARDAQLRERLNQLLQRYGETRKQAMVIVERLQVLQSARRAQADIARDSEPLRLALERVAAETESSGALNLWPLVLMGASLSALVVGVLGLLRVYVADQAQRAALAEAQKREAEAQEQEAKRVNDANQAAILRLMNELQLVAEGDLTQQATVTEDITGAIADSVNYTVEELRSLVAQVHSTAARVTDTTGLVDQTSTDLLAASKEQLHEIRATGEAVLQMAERINTVSSQAEQTAEVARHSRAAAESGLAAMQNNISGMNAIREHIQETSKRIKRLGESSQEIGEITELISDITEQTNVLALNAAIQAASAGEAGRGFSVVAEEVQRLAERSADATRRIAALVKAIQTDTQDAVAAMERSTLGVVQGTRLSDAAGKALEEIDEVSKRLDELIAQITAQARAEARSANEVASNIQHIFAVTEQTGEGTRSTAQMVHELSRSADALKASVARFKIS